MGKLIAGCDEAGRGPVLGSLFISIVVADDSTISKFKRLGVKDSKLVAHPKRVKLAEEIKKMATHYEVIQIMPHEIDTSKLNLNELEGAKIAQLINKFTPDKVIIDSPTANLEYYKLFLQAMLQYKPQLVVENYADKNHCIVGAASILAKVAREEEVEKLHKEWGDFGSGYPSDERTMLWLREYYAKHKKIPEIARKKWSTISEMEPKLKQKGLYEFNHGKKPE